MEQRLSLITLGVRDLEKSIRFYEGLGWKRSLEDAAGVAFFQLGGIGLSLYPMPELAADAGVADDAAATFRGIALAHNVRSREEVDALFDAMTQLGARVVRPPESKPWGGYSGYVADPDEHLWEIAWNPGFPLDDAGNLQIPK